MPSSWDRDLRFVEFVKALPIFCKTFLATRQKTQFHGNFGHFELFLSHFLKLIKVYFFFKEIFGELTARESQNIQTISKAL
jgi:hypothetical protein